MKNWVLNSFKAMIKSVVVGTFWQREREDVQRSGADDDDERD